MGQESVVHLRPLPGGHSGLLAWPMGPCSPSSTLSGVQPSGDIPLVMVLQLMGRRGLQTSRDWGKTPKSREFYETCAFAQGHDLVVVSPWLSARVVWLGHGWTRWSLRSFPTWVILWFPSCSLFISIHELLSPGKHHGISSRQACCWWEPSLGPPKEGRSFPALGCAVGLLTSWLRASGRLFGNAVTQDVLSRGKMHYSFFI